MIEEREGHVAFSSFGQEAPNDSSIWTTWAHTQVFPHIAGNAEVVQGDCHSISQQKTPACFFFLLTEIKIISLQEFITITAHTFPQATEDIAQTSPLEYLKSIYQYSSFQNSSKKLKTNKQKSYTAHQFTLLDADKLERIEKGEEQKAIPREVNNGYFSAIYCMKILVES